MITGGRSRLAAHTQTCALVLRWLLLALAATLPFELFSGLPLGALTLTNVEALTLLALAAWSALLLAERRWPHAPRWLWLGGGGLLLVWLLSALLAGPWRADALKFTLRQTQGLLLALCLADQLRSHGWPLLRQLAVALLVGAALSAALGLLELTQLGPLLALLQLFKEQPTLAGGLLRLSASFSYANIAAMYFEAALPLALLAAGLARGRRALWAALAALLLFLAVLLTYSRAALGTVALLTLLTALGVALRFRPPMTQMNQTNDRSLWPGTQHVGTQPVGTQRAASLQFFVVNGPLLVTRRLLALCGGLLALLAVMLLLPSFQTRIAEPDVDRWYRAEYQPSPVPPLAPNALAAVPVTLTNRGLVTWRSDVLRPVGLSYHWLDAQTRLVVRYNGRRTPLPAPLAPGETVTLSALVQAPSQPGSYLIVWDMVVEQSGWFSERGNGLLEQPVTVAGAPVVAQAAPAAEPANLPRRISARPPPPARSALWGAALQLWRAAPLLGIGPDIFRHVYGPALGLKTWDERVHTNNLYLEILVGTGISGALTFAVFLAAVALAGWRALRAPGRSRYVALGCLLALLGFLVHGVLDMFLEYSATVLLGWGLLGVLGACGTLQPIEEAA